MVNAMIKPSSAAKLALVLAAGLTAASCASSTDPEVAQAEFQRCRAIAGPLYRGAPSFAEWKARVRAVARRCGIGSWTVYRALEDVGEAKADDARMVAQVDARPTRRPLPGDTAAIAKATTQATTAQIAYAGNRTFNLAPRPRANNPIQAYLDLRITPEFVEKGRAMLARYRPLLERIEKRYGVPKEYLVAYWGIETNYGANTGRHDVIGTLARLGYGSKRRRFFADELLAALVILDNNYASRSQLYGSFAGAMGQPQFMPSSYLYYAVDGNDDGRRDIWRTPADIFASIAYYNVKRGKWSSDYRNALLEVKLPDDFPYADSGLDKPRPIEDWAKLGVTRIDGGPLPDGDGDALVYLPAGCEGPAFLLNGNFHAIMRYNNLIKYGFAVSVLAEKIRGDFTIHKPWPDGDVALTAYQRRNLQRLLAKLGHGNLATDGVFGDNTRAAIRSFQRKHRMCVDGHANLELYRRVRHRVERLYSMRQVTAKELAEAQYR